MREFTDRAGYSWPIDLADRSTLERLRAVRFNPATALADDAAVYEHLRAGSAHFRDVLWAAVRPLAEADGLTPAGFASRLDLHTLTTAARALLLAAADTQHTATARAVRTDFDGWFFRLVTRLGDRAPKAWPFDFSGDELLDGAADRAALTLENARIMAGAHAALAAEAAVVPPGFWERQRAALAEAADLLRAEAEAVERLIRGEHVADNTGG